jgi:purine-binding chemotaxis protein CheW
MSGAAGRGGGATRARSSDRRGAAHATRDGVQLCAFLVGDDHFAVDIMPIKEIINTLPITRVPKAPPFIEGVIELRGAILPIVDLRKRFDLPAAPPTRATKFMIVALAGQGGERWIVGLIVDKVLEVLRIGRSEIQRPPAMAQGETDRFFAGACRHRDRIVMVIDLDALLTTGERQSLAGMAQGLPLPLLPSSMPPVPVERRGRDG